MKKKGQAAMEFLMTYGWAILVVIAAIAALAYFGVLDPSRLLPERCQFPAGMDCIDKASVTSTNVVVALRNNLGFAAEVSDVRTESGACTGTPLGAIGADGLMNDTWPKTVANNEVFRLNLTTCSLSGSKFDDTIIVDYKNVESGLQNQAVGDVRGRIAE